MIPLHRIMEMNGNRKASWKYCKYSFVHSSVHLVFFFSDHVRRVSSCANHQEIVCAEVQTHSVPPRVIIITITGNYNETRGVLLLCHYAEDRQRHRHHGCTAAMADGRSLDMAKALIFLRCGKLNASLSVSAAQFRGCDSLARLSVLPSLGCCGGGRGAPGRSRSRAEGHIE